MTNFEEIKSMDIDELTRLIDSHGCYICVYAGTDTCHWSNSDTCRDGIKKSLEQEASNE